MFVACLSMGINMNLWDLINWAFSECIALVAKTPAGRRLRPIVKKTRSTIATFFIRRPYLIVLAVCALFLYLLTNPELLRDHLPFSISSQDCYKIDDNTMLVRLTHTPPPPPGGSFVLGWALNPRGWGRL